MRQGKQFVSLAIAFALIAHVPPEHGLYAMIVPTIRDATATLTSVRRKPCA